MAPLPSVSRHAAVITGLGALAVVLAFAGAIYQLSRIEERLDALNRELEAKTAESVKLSAEISGLRTQRRELAQQLEKYRQLSVTLNHAITQVWSRKYEEALPLFDEVLSLDNQNLSALYWKSLGCYRLGRHEEAIAAATRALSHDENYFDPYVTLAFALTKQGRQAEAVERLRHALDLNIHNYAQLCWRTADVEELQRIPAFNALFDQHQRTLKQIQIRLKQLNYYQGPVDALIGEGTLESLNAFYARSNIQTEPTVTRLLELLNAATPR